MMFLPLHDENPLKVIRFQGVTAALVVINVAVFLYTHFALDQTARYSLYLSFGMVPAVLSGHAVLADELRWIPPFLTPLTSLFLHGGWMHLAGNMAFLWVFADNVEDGFGHVRFLLFYLFCGLAAALFFLLLAPASRLPLIGASGAISGVLASYLVLFPRTNVLGLFALVPLQLPALWLLAAWLLFNLLAFLAGESGAGVAWGAHLGGFMTGLVLTWPLRWRIRARLLRGQAARRRRARQGPVR